jgi:enoyl-[acyl-carrier protein] reductase II
MNRLTSLLDLRYPIVQAGMVWCSGWKLAAAVSNAGGLGVIGSGSMRPEVLEHHLLSCKQATSRPFAVNLPLLYPSISDHIALILQHQVPIVITSAGNPAMYTETLKKAGIIVIHVVSSSKFALKAEAAGCSAVVAEGFEAGGHNGREETTTLCLVPEVVKAVQIPVIAAGGIASGAAMLAAMALGAEGVQIGTRFVASEESSAHINFKSAVIRAKEGDTTLTLKELTPVRLLKNEFFELLQTSYRNGDSPMARQALLGKGRAKKGMFEGDMIDGELEIGQASSQCTSILPAGKIMEQLVLEYNSALKAFHQAKLL